MAVNGTPAPPAELFARARAARLASADLLSHGVLGARRSVAASMQISPACPGVARRLLASLARDQGAAPSAVSAAETVVSELVSNVVRHAYDGPSGLVRVQAARVGDGLTLIVIDDGRGPHVASPNAGLGLGWKIVAQLAESFTILESSTGGTHICARIGLGTVGPLSRRPPWI